MDRKTFLYSTVTGIVAIVVFSYVIEPVSIFIWHFTTSESNYFFKTIQNGAISNAAIGKRDWIVPTLMCWLAAIIQGIFFGQIAIISIKRSLTKTKNHGGEKSVSEKSKNFAKRMLFFLFFLTLILAMCLTDFAYGTFVDLQLNASFDQRMNALAPYIDDQQQKILRSNWAMMETLEDYRALTTQMDVLAAKSNIKLPKVLYR